MDTPPPHSPAEQLHTALTDGDAQTRIDAIRTLNIRLTQTEQQIASDLRHHGMDWEDIGHMFGITRRAAHKRFAATIDLDHQEHIMSHTTNQPAPARAKNRYPWLPLSRSGLLIATRTRKPPRNRRSPSEH